MSVHRKGNEDGVAQPQHHQTMPHMQHPAPPPSQQQGGASKQPQMPTCQPGMPCVNPR